MIVLTKRTQRPAEALLFTLVKVRGRLRERALTEVARAALFTGLLAWWAIGASPQSWISVAPPGVPAAAAAEVSYVYDGAGRLIAVVDSSGDAVTYDYD